MKGKDKTKAQLLAELAELRRELSAFNRSKADHDPLTGLPNHYLLYDRLTQVLLQANRKGTSVAILFLFLQDLKIINDNYGHETGDKFLKATANRIQEGLRKSDTLARPGRNEFIILLADLHKTDDTILIVEKIMHLFDLPFLIDEKEIFIECKVGISHYPADGADADTLLKNAYTAMNNARAETGHYMFFSEAMNAKALYLFHLANDLRRAINHNEFVLHYQPQLDLQSGRITGMEALVRWQRPGKGLVFPSDFIHEVETTGMIVAIGEWVLETACAQQKKWQEAGIAPELIAVNVSATQFYQKNIIGKILDILHRTGLDPKALELELTENVVFKEDGIAFATLVELKKLGVNISIDDFGTGYSSLSMLKKFPADKLKIVGSFVRSISINPVDSAIAKLIIDLSRVLSINVVAEGIETEEQLEFLCTAGCNAVQGYLFCRPVDATEATRLLTERTDAVSAQWAAGRKQAPQPAH